MAATAVFARVAARGTFTPTDARPGDKWPTPGALARDLDPRTVQTPALDLIDEALVWVSNTPDGRLVITMPPQEGKSDRVTRRWVEWLLSRRPHLRGAIASYSHSVARRMGRIVRDDIADHGPKLGLRIRDDVSGQAEWQIAGHGGGIYAVGIAGSLTSRPADFLVIDDPLKGRKEAESETYRQQGKDFWTGTAGTRLAPGAPVVVVLTRWHEDDLAGWLLARPDGHRWRVVNIPAQADHDPGKGETDPLGREPGEFLESARGRTDAQWEAIKVQAGSRDWQALYQGRPSAPEGDVLKRAWWREYDTPQWVERDDGARIVPGVDGLHTVLVQSWDMTFKDAPTKRGSAKTAGTDYVVGQVWLRRGAEALLLDQVRRRMDLPDTLRAVRQLSAKWPQAAAKYIEDKANGPAVIASLRQSMGGLIPVEPEGGKEARTYAVTPFIEAGNVWLPHEDLAPWVGDFVEEAAGFPNATHDDQVDAATQAIARLLLDPVLAGEEYDMDDLDDELAAYSIGPNI